MKLATSTGDLEWYIESSYEKVKAFKDTKFKYLNAEICGDEFLDETDDGWKRTVDNFGNAAADAGLKFVAAHAPCVNVLNGDEEHYNVTLRALRRSIEACHILGIDRITIHASYNKKHTGTQFFSENKKVYSQLFDLMEKYDVRAMTENMDTFAYYPLSTGKEIREFVDYIDHPLMGVCWDVAHAHINPKTKYNPQYDSIVTIGDKLFGLHVADNFGDCHHHTWPFAGIINFDEIIQGLLDANYKGYFTYEASYTLLHSKNMPYHRQPWVHNGETVTKLLNPSLELKKEAIDLLYDVGKHMLSAYDCFEE